MGALIVVVSSCAIGVGGLVGAFCLSLIWSRVCGTGGRAGRLDQRFLCTAPRVWVVVRSFWFDTALSGGIPSRKNMIFACAVFYQFRGVLDAHIYLGVMDT